ncbi:DNA-binding transcriptional regulator, MarR family [Propionibacterium cyclohexanicum]|uniref:DNA-binding transcriptional regulator, MarR family n=1 Tax=Propionibacterium cyclohexanicum TaxID=64702 RepID=A0A1H9QDW3_9ACTN|nr:MarR family transcriptional regulator [Propionibacterium cyclohexanicum]SER58003.1 DNA-binding transcriptional regulator, MarR family [Propionibacterium cyclohexanicum]
MAEAELSPADALAQLSFLVHARIEAHSGARGLSVTQIRMLGILRDRTPLIGELGARLGLDKSSISGLVGRAARRGLVERVPSAQDRRAIHVQLTDAGRALASSVQADVEADVDTILAPLGTREAALLVHLASLLLAAQPEPGTPGTLGTG